MDPAPTSPSFYVTVHPRPRHRHRALTTRYHLVPLVSDGDAKLGGSLHGSEDPPPSSSFFRDVIPIVFRHSPHDGSEAAVAQARARANVTTDGACVVARDGTTTGGGEVRPPAMMVLFSEPLGREDVVTSLLSSCRDPSCRGRVDGGGYCSNGRRRRVRSSGPDCAGATEGESTGSKGSRKRNRSSSRRRWCGNCVDVLVAQRFLSKTMLRFSLSPPSVGGGKKGEDAEEGDGDEEAGTVLRLYVAGPNAPMVHLNDVPVVSAVEDDSPGSRRHDDAGAPTVPDGADEPGGSGAPLSPADDGTSRFWRDGGLVRVGDVLSLVNLDSRERAINEATAPSLAPAPTYASAHRAKDGDEGRNDRHRRESREWSSLRFVVASATSVATGESEVIDGSRWGQPDASNGHVSRPVCASSATEVGPFENRNVDQRGGGGSKGVKDSRGQRMTSGIPPASSPQRRRQYPSDGSTPLPGKWGRDADDVEKCNDGNECSRGGGGLHGGDGADRDEDDDGGRDGVVEVEMEDSSPMLTMPRFSHPSAAAEHLFTATATATATCTYGGVGGPGTESDWGASPSIRHGRRYADAGSSAAAHGGNTPSSSGLGGGPATEAEDVVPVASLGVDEIRRLRDNSSRRHPPSSFRHALLSIALMREDRRARRRGRQHGGREGDGDVPPRHHDRVDDGETGGAANGDSPSSSRPPLRLPTLLRDTVVPRSDVYPM